jgi:ribosomal protein S18 acetylase RimI-like enzyme
MTRSASSPPPLSNDTGIRARLHQDPYWAVYALGDLDPRRAHHCDWFISGESIALLYREFDTPILWAAGQPEVMEALPPELDACLLQIPESFLPAVARRLTVESSRLVYRMSLAPAAFMPYAGALQAELLDERHEDEIRELYEDGRATHEDPDFFMRSQLQDGTFVGVRHEGRLVAAGGTHLYSRDESVGAIGNVYTHRAHRGRGCASAVTSAIARELIDRGTRIIALNVRSENEAAIRVYERLGFRLHAPFWEGRATGRP